jgi:hypothetical protein
MIAAPMLMALLALSSVQAPAQQSATFTVGITIVRTCTVLVNGVSTPISCTGTGQAPLVIERTTKAAQQTNVDATTHVITIIY